MYLLVILAFALVLSDTLPPPRWNLLSHSSSTLILGIILAQLLLFLGLALWLRRRTLIRLLAGASEHEQVILFFSRGQMGLMGLMAVEMAATMVLTSWAPIVRIRWNLGAYPLAADVVLLTPFFLSVAAMYAASYSVERRIRRTAQAMEQAGEQQEARRENAATAALAAATGARPAADATMAGYLVDKFRHQVLIVAAPMVMIVLAKYFTDRGKLSLYRWTSLPWAADAVLGIVSFLVLLSAPVMLRYIWATEPLPAGPLRDRFVRTCRRIGLRYREILLWHTHGLTVNAAVMGFVAPMRYILVSDALLETMDEEEIEAVFGHEAGHIRHWHLQFFGLFALVAMYVSGGVLELLLYTGWVMDASTLQLIALAILMGMWLVGFGWLSRRFERQADLFGVRCVTPDIQSCVSACRVHGNNAARLKPKATSLCLSAVNLFGRTLLKIADLNGIPREAPSWRHGSIASRCRLIEEFAGDEAALGRFDRRMTALKAGLAVASLIGTAGAVWIYYPSVARALGWRTWIGMG